MILAVRNELRGIESSNVERDTVSLTEYESMWNSSWQRLLLMSPDYRQQKQPRIGESERTSSQVFAPLVHFIVQGLPPRTSGAKADPGGMQLRAEAPRQVP